MKSLILCADDYGQNYAISDGILHLIKLKRLNATSCLTNGLHWAKSAKALQEFQDQVDIGLHFNLTHGEAITLEAREYFLPLSKLMIKAFTRQIKQLIIENELRAQLDMFAKELGRLPDFIDGHQHIHHLPIIRDALLKVYQEYYPYRQAYIRAASNPSWYKNFTSFKGSVIALTGALQLRRQMQALEIPHNTTFSGIYDFSPSAHYPELFRRFVSVSQSDGIIMCHPGLGSNDLDDPIREARVKEYQYLSGELFLQDCAKLELSLFKKD